jgi:basic membrane protein A
VTSAMKLIDKGVASLIESIADGTFQGGNFFGEVGLAPYHDFESVISDEVKGKVEALTPQVLDGSVPTGVKL